MNNLVVLDASAVLALIHREPGYQEVARHMEKATALSTVNLAEIVGKQQEFGIPPEKLMSLLELLGVEIYDLNSSLAIQIGWMRFASKSYGLSLGDLACIALGKQLDAPVLTADRAWAQTDFGVEIILIRP